MSVRNPDIIIAGRLLLYLQTNECLAKAASSISMSAKVETSSVSTERCGAPWRTQSSRVCRMLIVALLS